MIIKALIRRLHFIILFPLIVAGIVAWLQMQKPREYQSGMIFYTGVASGSTPIDQGDGRIDHFAVNNAFDNLLAIIESREVVEEVSMRLLTQHLLLEEPSPTIISPPNLRRLREQLLTTETTGRLVVEDDYQATLQNIKEEYLSGQTNEINYLLNSSQSFYNVNHIRDGLLVRRQRNSDMLEVIYRSSDPGVCYSTLKILADVFILKNSDIRRSEAGGIIEYFEAQLRQARENLSNAEETLKIYSQENQIINYNEQTKYLAASKEELERDIYHERSNLNASRDALIKLERQFDSRERLYLNSEEIIRKRDSISEINNQISALTIFGRPGSDQKLADLREKADKLQKDLTRVTEEFVKLNYTTEAVPMQTLLNTWLIAAIEADKSSSKLETLESQRYYYDNEFNILAPVGFNLSRMDREIDIAEREYLTILHGLNMARLRQSSFEQFGTLELLDEPFFPLNPRASRAKLLVIGSFIASLFFISALFAGLELLNRSLRTPLIAENQTGLEPLCVLPRAIKNRSINSNLLHNKLFALLCNTLNFSIKRGNPPNPPLIIIFSTREQSATGNVSLLISKALHTIYNESLCLISNQTQPGHITADETGPEILTFSEDVGDLDQKIESIKSSKKPAVIQLPEFEKQNISPFLNLEPFMNVLVVDASQTWDFNDKKILKNFKNSYPASLHKFALNNMDPNHLDDFITSLPRKRSFLRKWVKRLLKLNF